jgi:hypothetical protein
LFIDPQEKELPICPVCGMECYTVYRVVGSGEVVGCDMCLEEQDARDYFSEEEIE